MISHHLQLVLQLSAMSFVVNSAILRIDVSIGPSMFSKLTIDNSPNINMLNRCRLFL